MDFHLYLVIVVATISYTVYGKYKQISTDLQQSTTRHTTEFNQTRIQENKTLVTSSSPPSRNWEYHVFVSFRGEDVREGFLSHLLKEFKRKGINPFIDNGMKKGASISPELKRAIKGSKIAIVLISKNYASSSWCLNELVKIIKCRRKIGQKVITIFYQVEPTDVKKQVGDFGKVFEETCKGKPSDVIHKWKEALVKVATIVGYDSTKWVDESSAIEEVANDISTMLNHLAHSHYLDRFIGMEAHMEKIQLLLRLDLEDEVRMIGIWGPFGIGKSTICRYLYEQLSSTIFQLSAIMVNIKQSYPNPCFDEGSAQLQLQSDMLSKMINHKDIIVTHLGSAQDRLKDKKVLLVLDDVDQLAQLVALAEDNRWFGPGSRIIVATEDQRVLMAHGIGFDRIYKVNYPSDDEAFQIFCMHAFPRKFPDDGFTELAREVTYLVGNLPLGLQVLGSYFLRRPKHEWIEALPKLRSRLDGKIETLLKFSYDAICDDEYKDLFLHIACYFNFLEVERVEAYLAERFTDVRQGLQVLAEKSLISFEDGFINMHNLLIQLGEEIVRKQSEKRQFMINANDITDILTDYTTITTSVVGIEYQSREGKEITISDRSFEGMPNLQFLTIDSFHVCPSKFSLSECFINIPSKLRLLHWEYSPMTCWPTIANLEFLVELYMPHNKLEKLWDGIKPLPRLKWMGLSSSKNLKKLPNLSTATSLKNLDLSFCSSLVELPCSIGNVTNLQHLDLRHCSSLVKLSSSIGSATNLQDLNLCYCSSLVELPCSIGNATNLQSLDLSYCSSLVELPSSIGNATNLQSLDLSYCVSLVQLPSSIGNATNLQSLDLSNCSSLVEIPSFIGNATNLQKLNLRHWSSLVELPSSIWNSTNLQELNLSHCSSLVELSSSIGNAINLQMLSFCYCSSLVEIPSSIGNLHKLETLLLYGCSMLEFLPTNINMERLDSLFLSDCLLLKNFPEISTNISYLDLTGTAVEEVPSSIKSWSHLEGLCMSYSERLLEIPHALDMITTLDLTDLEEIQELGTWINGFTRLNKLVLNGMRKLVLLRQLSNSLEYLEAENCESLETLDCSFRNPNIHLNFKNCFKLNQEARDLIVQTTTYGQVILPGREVPTYFNFKACRNILTVKLDEKEPLGTPTKYRACVLLVNDGVWDRLALYNSVASRYKKITILYRSYKGSKEETSSENLFIFDIEVEEMISTEFDLEFYARKSNHTAPSKLSEVEIKECGVVILET